MSTVPIQPLPPVMTTDEVAAILRCSVRTVRAYVHSHQLDAIQIGRERVRHAQTAGLLALLPDEMRLLGNARARLEDAVETRRSGSAAASMHQ